MPILYTLLAGTFLVVIFDQPLLGVVLAAAIFLWLFAKWWPCRHQAHNPNDY